MRIRLTIRIIGKIDAARIPLWMSLSLPVQNPTRDGPNVPPKSPAKASSAKSAVPPPGIRADVILIEPGHIMPTAKPLIIQPAKLISGSDDNDAVKYATTHRIPETIIYDDKSRSCPFLPYQSRLIPIQKAKPQGPAKSPIALSTPREASAKADVHCAMVLSDAPAATIRIMNIQKIRFLSN